MIDHLVRTHELLVSEARVDTLARSHAGCNSHDLLRHTLRMFDGLMMLREEPNDNASRNTGPRVSISCQSASTRPSQNCSSAHETGSLAFPEVSVENKNVVITPLIPLTADHPGAGSFVVDGAFDEEFLLHLDTVWEGIPTSVTCGAQSDDTDDPASISGEPSTLTFNANNASRSSKENARTFSKTCATRKFLRDREKLIVDTIETVLEHVIRTESVGSSGAPTKVFPRMRFLHYGTVGGQMMPHVDLSKSDSVGAWGAAVRSTHTFLLHLRDCTKGGETVLLRSLSEATKRAVGDENVPPATNRGKSGIAVEEEVLATKRSSVGGNKSEAALSVASNNGAVLVATSAAAGEVEACHRYGDDVLASVPPRRGRLLVFPHVCPHAGLRVGVVPKMFLRGELV